MIDRAYNRVARGRTIRPAPCRPRESVSRITRTICSRLRERYWRPDLTTIAVVGDVTPDAGAQRAGSGVRLVARRRTEARSAQSSRFRRAAQRPRLHRHRRPIKSSSVSASRRISRSNTDYNTFLVLNQILGGKRSFESRLWQELRQKRGLVYSVGSTLDADADRGDFRIELSASPQRVVEAGHLRAARAARAYSKSRSRQRNLQEAKVRLVGNALLEEASSSGKLDSCSTSRPTIFRSTITARSTSVSRRSRRPTFSASRAPISSRASSVEVYAGPSGPWAQHAL